MQGHASAVGSLSETLNIDHGSTPSGTGSDQQVCWNSVRNSASDRLSEYISPSNEDTGYRSPRISNGQNLGAWSMDEPNSSVVLNRPSHGEQKAELTWASTMMDGSGPSLANQQHESASGLSLNNYVNLNSNQIANGPLFMQSSSSNSISQDLNIHAGSEGQCVDDYQNVERPLVIRSRVENLRSPNHSRSSNPFELQGDEYMEGNDGMPSRAPEGRRLSRKRKATEEYAGQSSSNGSSNYFQHAEHSAWRAIPAPRNTGSSSTIPVPSEDTLGINQSEQVSSRLILGVGGVPSEIAPTISTVGSAENSHRNLRSRTNSSQQGFLPSNAFTTENGVGSSSTSISASRQSLRLLPEDSSSSPAVTDANTQVQFRVHIPSMRQNLQSSRRSRNSSSMAGGTSTATVEGDAVSPGESSLRRISGNTMEHPIFVASSVVRNSGQSSNNRTVSGGNVGHAGTAASSSQGGSAAGSHRTSGLNRFPHRSSQQYPRRLSELVRRSLYSASGHDSGAQNTNSSPPGSSTSDSTPDVPLPSEVQWPHLSQSRSAISLDGHLDGASRIHSLRTLATAVEGRSRLVSEIRDVLDLMRRGEGLRFEDVMLLDHSVLFGMGDYHDRHRDMRVDVDNMSYEELLALEERIGNVNTGLSEETIASRLKQARYTVSSTNLQDQEPCCVCQEEYNNGDDLGELECGHNFHVECIKKWLAIKNLCPICKTTGMANGEKP